MTTSIRPAWLVSGQVRGWFNPALQLCCLLACSGSAGAATDLGGNAGTLMKLHRTRWNIDGKPVLGTYGAERVPDLQSVHEAGMNVVLAGHAHLDPSLPEGAFCREHGMKVLHHLTHFLYHRIRLSEPITADQTTLPLLDEHGAVDEGSHLVQIDDEIIRYEKMTKTALLNCQRGCTGTRPAAHREGIILFWPEGCAAEITKVKNSPNLFGYYVLDDSPGDAVSALRAMYQTIQKVDPGHRHPVCAGYGNTGSLANFAPGVCDILAIYQYPVGSRKYDRERTSLELQHILTAARRRVPGVPFLGIYQAFDGGPAKTGQGVPTPEQLREQLEDFVREGACGLIAFICHNPSVPGWGDIPALGEVVKQADREILATGGLRVRRETESMQRNRFQPAGHWRKPRALPGVVPAWYVMGPFEDTSGKMLDGVLPPDWEVDLAAVYPVKLGKAGWRLHETVNGTLGLTALWGEQLPNGVAYAVCYVTSPREQAVQLRISSDDDARVRINGREVYRHQEPGGLEYDKEIVPITLPAGKARIEIKVFNRRGMWGLFTRFTDQQGRPLKGLHFTPGEAVTR